MKTPLSKEEQYKALMAAAAVIASVLIKHGRDATPMPLALSIARQMDTEIRQGLELANGT